MPVAGALVRGRGCGWCLVAVVWLVSRDVFWVQTARHLAITTIMNTTENSSANEKEEDAFQILCGSFFAFFFFFAPSACSTSRMPNNLAIAVASLKLRQARRIARTNRHKDAITPAPMNKSYLFQEKISESVPLSFFSIFFDSKYIEYVPNPSWPC